MKAEIKLEILFNTNDPSNCKRFSVLLTDEQKKQFPADENGALFFKGECQVWIAESIDFTSEKEREEYYKQIK